jgi:FMN phosphatase YigB (HAD superfamily)
VIIQSKISNNTVLFFDLDGTLVDTDYANFLSYKCAIEKIIGKSVLLEFDPNIRFNRTILKTKFPNFDSNILAKIIQAKEILYQDFLPKMQIIPHTTDILLKYTEPNKTVLVSNCRANRVTEILNYYNITDKFNHIFCRQSFDDKTRSNKYSNALANLNIFPQSVIVFENEKNEIHDAIKAGIPIRNIIEFNNF